MAVTQMATSQTILKGNIQRATNDSLEGNSVSVPGTMLGFASDANGDFELLVPSGQDSVRFDYLGFKSMTLPLSTGKMLVVMEEES